jgi:hypothetical protein
MSINLLFSNPNVPLIPLNMKTWNAMSTGGTIAVTGTQDQINTNTAGGTTTISLPDEVIFPGSANIPTLNINSSYTMPSTIGTAGQVLSVPNSGSTLIWSSDAGGTVDSVTGSSNINVNPNTGNVVVSLNPNLELTSLSINSSYTMPSNIGTAGQVLGVSNGLLEFINQSESINQITNTDNNLNITNESGDVTINLSNGISINGFTLNGKTFQNPTTGSENQVLSLDSNNNMVWSTDTLGGVQTINCSDNNINVNQPSGNVTLSLSSTVDIQNLEINNKSFQNPTSGNANQSLTLDNSNNMIWSYVVNDVSCNDNNINVSNPNGSVVLSLSSTVNISNLEINGKTFENPSLGSTGQVLVLDSNNNMVWGSDALGGVTSINNSDGNISVSNPTGTVTLDLATSIAVENITIGLAPDTYAMPSTIGSNGQILGIAGTTVQWVNDTQGNFTVQGTENEINSNTVNDVCTLSLPPIVSFPGDVYIGTGTLNSDNITNLNGISTGSLSCSGGLSMYNCNFQSPSLGTNGSVLTIDTSTNPFSLNWSNPTGQVTSVVGGVDGNILATPLTGTGNVVLTLGNTIEVTELDCQTINCQNTITSSVLNVGDEFLGSGFNYFGKSLQNPTNANAGSVLNLGPNNSMLWSDSPTLYDLNVNNQCTIDLLSVTTGIQFNGSNLGNPSTAAEGDILTIDANNNMIWATAPGVLSTSFNFEFLGSGNTMGLGNATIINNNGIVTLRFPFTTPQSYGKQIYIPAFTTGLFTCSSLPPPYRPINLITFTVPVIVPTLDLNNDPNGYLTSYTMTIQITTGGSIYFTLFQNIGANGPLPFMTNFIAGTPYMINSCYWGSPYNGDFTCTYPAIA